MKKILYFVAIVVFALNLFVTGLPIDSSDEVTTEIPGNDTSNNTHKELFVIKVVTYEVGIIADVSNDDNRTEDGPLVHQQVDLTFYDTNGNDSFIDFGDIPLPVQTNVSGQIITGLAPVHIGAQNISNAGNILQTLPITGKIVNITHSDTSYINLSRENISLADQIVSLDKSEDLSHLPILNDVLLPENFKETIGVDGVPSSELPAED